MANIPSFLQNIFDILSPIFNFILGLYNQLSEFEFLNNSGIDYLLVPIIFILSFLLSYTSRYIIINRTRAWMERKESMMIDALLSKVKSLLNLTSILLISTYFSLQHLVLSAPFQLAMEVIVFGGLLVALSRFLMGLIDIGADFRQDTTEEDQTHILSFVQLVGKIVISSLLLLWYLSLLEVDVTGLAAGLGIAGITIAFALQNIAADLFSAVAIYLDRPFELGDYIQVNDKGGTVERIGIRTTHLRSPDGPLIVISNQILTGSDVTNFGKMERRRVQQTVGVSADTPTAVLRQLPIDIEQIIGDIDQLTVDRIWLKELGDFSWNYELIFFIETADITKYREVQEEVNFRLLELMEGKDIEIPYPIQEVILNSKDNLFEPLETRVKQAKKITN